MGLFDSVKNLFKEEEPFEFRVGEGLEDGEVRLRPGPTRTLERLPAETPVTFVKPGEPEQIPERVQAEIAVQEQIQKERDVPSSIRSRREQEREERARQITSLFADVARTTKKLVITRPEGLREDTAEAFRQGILETASAFERTFAVGAKKVGADQLAKRLNELADQDSELAKVGIRVDDAKKLREGLKDPNWVARGVARNIPNLLAGLGVAAPAAVAGAPALVAGGLTFGTTAALEAGFAFNEAKGHGATDEQAEKAMGFTGVINGLLETLPIMKLVNRSPAATQIKKSILRRVIGDVTSQIVAESSTESLQEIVSNAVARTYDEERPLFSGVPEAAFFGGLIGGGTGLFGSVVKQQVQVPGLTIEEVSDRNLIAVHNLSEKNFNIAKKIGGLANPSLAVIDPKKGILEGFGEISLIAEKELIDPKFADRGKTFAADIYSPRFPGVKTVVSDFKKLRLVEEKLGINFNRIDTDDFYNSAENDFGLMRVFLNKEGIDTSKFDPESFVDKGEIRELVEPLQDKFQKFISNIAEEAGIESKLWGGFTPSGRRRYLEFTAENASKLMSKDALKGGEGFFYGLGSVRSRIAPKFSSIEKIKKNQGKLVSRSDFEELKKGYEKEFGEILKKLEQYDTIIDDNQFIAYDRAAEALGEHLAGIDEGFFNEKFQGVPLELKQRIKEFGNSLKEMPTQYFETKFTRVVQPREFRFAVVPDNITETTRKLLNDDGLEIVEYKAGDGVSRAEKIKGLSERVAFSISETEVDITKTEARKILDDLFGKDDVEFLTKKWIEPRRRKDGTLDKVYGQYADGLITILEEKGLVSEFTTLHEAFHHYFRTYLTAAERKSLFKVVVESNPDVEFTAEIGPEEWLADNFAAYVSKRKTFTGKIAAFYNSVKSRIESWIKKQPSVIRHYNDLLSGKVVERKQVSRATGVAFKRQIAKPEELTGLKAKRKKMLDDFLATQEGEAIQELAILNAEMKGKLKKEVLSGIKNNPFFRKEKSIKDVMGIGWLMERKGKSLVLETERLDEFEAKGWVRKIEIDTLAQEAGFESGEDYLQEHVDLDGLETSVRKLAELELAAQNREFASTLELLGIIKKEIKGQKVTMEKFMTELGKRTRTSVRRRQVVAIRDYFGLTDRELKQISVKDVAFMTETEYKAFLYDIEAKAAQYADTLQKRLEIVALINDRQLQRSENVRKALQLPTLDKMSDGDLEAYLDLLSQYQFGDVFLTTRTLETLRTTDLKEARTIREIREDIASKSNVSLEDLEKVKVSAWDKVTPDATLMEQNGFYQLLVKMTHEALLGSDTNLLKMEREVAELARASRASRSRKLGDYFAPLDTEVIKYLETPVAQRDPSNLTKEELAYASYIDAHYTEALEYLQTMSFLHNGIDGYYTHIRRGFLETVREDGVLQAFKEIFSQQKLDQMTAEIIGSDTDIILAKHKFFQFAQKRSGQLVPTQNAAKAFIAYQTAFQKKRALDAVVPVLDAYVYSLAPTETTERGLEMDRTLKKFFNEWMNNKKGRRFSFGGAIKQNSGFDIALRMGKNLVSLIDLGLNIPVAVTPFVGEAVLNIQALGVKDLAIARARRVTKKGKAIIKEYESLIGKTVWQSITEASKSTGDKVMEGVYSPFTKATREANIDFLLAKMSKEEFESGRLSEKRQAEIKLERARYRHVSDTKSIVGATSAGSASTQYKTWALPTLITTAHNIRILSKRIIAREGKDILKSRESRETMRFIVISMVTYLAISSLFDDEEDDTLYGQVLSKVKRESLTLLGAVDPTLMTGEPRLLSFLDDLAKNIKALILLERYKTKEGLKGLEGLKRTFTPRAIKQFQTEKKKKNPFAGLGIK
jgi:hypothetical protein|tara:strand:+ start:9822 stop:15347 length:5526 start_codon:yes stop_codon:yes gene_type:complete